LYGANRQAATPFRLHLTGLTGQLASQLEHTITTWQHVAYTPEEYTSVFSHDQLVYLTADSENVLDTFDPSKVYIIGGIVDHNRLVDITKIKAAEHGITTARLPFDKYVNAPSRKVITVNQGKSQPIKDMAWNGMEWNGRMAWQEWHGRMAL
jgi:tRNA (guanine9-N1)-methyltransferase